MLYLIASCIPFIPKGEFLKELYEWSHWLECYHYLVLFINFLTPLRPVAFIVVGGWVGRNPACNRALFEKNVFFQLKIHTFSSLMWRQLIFNIFDRIYFSFVRIILLGIN